MMDIMRHALEGAVAQVPLAGGILSHPTSTSSISSSLLPDNFRTHHAAPVHASVSRGHSSSIHTSIVDIVPSLPQPTIPTAFLSHAPNQQSAQSEAVEVANGPTNTPESPMLKPERKAVSIISTVLSIITFTELFRHFGPKRALIDEDLENDTWIASSPSWWDRTACRYIGICGAGHLWNKEAWVDLQGTANQLEPDRTSEDEATKLKQEYWMSGKDSPEDWSSDERVLREIPPYVVEYAPLVHLFSGEQFWPCDIAEHLIHTTPHLNYTPLQAKSDHPKLTDLDNLNQWGWNIFLKSDDNVEERPGWLGGKNNIPEWPGDDDDVSTPDEDFVPDPPDNEEARKDWWEVGEGDVLEHGGIRNSSEPVKHRRTGPEQAPEQKTSQPRRRKSANERRQQTQKQPGGRSDAPAVLVVVDKGDDVVDAFWFFFYSYNLGNVVLNVRFGNHVGDWEHTVVRFHKGKPKAMYFSEHNFGDAFSYAAVEKIGKRPVAYSAVGTHAMYATPGSHPYVLPWGILHDTTDRGPLWDPLLNSFAYTYDYLNDTLRASTLTPKAPTNWFYFIGHWGDKFYPLSDRRQYRFAGQYHYVNGPFGPRFKNLGRKKICQGNGECIIHNWLRGSNLPKIPSEEWDRGRHEVKRDLTSEELWT